jgi:hypothetical protein
MDAEREQLQAEMDRAYGNYLALSDVLLGDLRALDAQARKERYLRRNFVRSSAVMIEGYAHCLRDLCSVGLKSEAPELSQKEGKVIRDEASFNTADRVKLTLKAAHRLFDLSQSPNFGGEEWVRAQEVFKKRDKLMHPKEPGDLDISDDEWGRMRQDIAWLIEQFTSFHAQMLERYENANGS